MEKILISAIKQSLKSYIPTLNELSTFKELVSKSTVKNKFIAHCYEGEKPHLKTEQLKSNETLVLIGPEGDFSLEEVEFAKEHGFKEISLGTARLRTERAGIVACHIVNLINE